MAEVLVVLQEGAGAGGALRGEQGSTCRVLGSQYLGLTPDIQKHGSSAVTEAWKQQQQCLETPRPQLLSLFIRSPG